MSANAWAWVVLVRQIDKVRAGLPADASAVLMALAMHADKGGRSFPGEDLLSRETGVPLRSLQRALTALKDEECRPVLDGSERPCKRGTLGCKVAHGVGVVSVKRRRQASSIYQLSAARLAGLPQIESRHAGGSGDPSRAAKTEAETRQNGHQDPPKQGFKIRQGGGQNVSENVLMNVPGEERAPAAPSPVRGEGGRIAEAEIEEALRLADDIAKQHGRPKPQRGAKSRASTRDLVAAIRSKGLDLSDVLHAHYAREDPGLAQRRWGLRLALQVVESFEPPKPRRPTQAEEDRERLAWEARERDEKQASRARIASTRPPSEPAPIANACEATPAPTLEERERNALVRREQQLASLAALQAQWADKP